MEELGFEYDSSIFPIIHDRYGIPDAPRFKYKLQKHNIWEYPISTTKFFGQKIPVSGGNVIQNNTSHAVSYFNKLKHIPPQNSYTT